MYICYVDESGTPDVPGNTSHFVLAGISVPIWHWRNADREISEKLKKYGLDGKELHTAWLLRPYLEQRRIPDFEKLDWKDRRRAVEKSRNAHLLKLQRSQNNKPYKQARKNYKATTPYTHLTHKERSSLVQEIAELVSRWRFARLFAECIDKIHFDPTKTGRTVNEQAFEQVISRFEKYLQNTDANQSQKHFGLLVHDNNQTVARKHTELMRRFHRKGTLWTNIDRIIETPLFVDSSLTSLIQIADLCSYSLRRFVENGETDLFERVFVRADRVGDKVVGVRHFCDPACACRICREH